MTEINNFKKVENFITFNSDDEFYMIQIIKRRKDNEYLTKNTVLVDTFYVYSKASLLKYKDLIIDKCTSNNARAYITVRKRSLKTIALEVLSKTAHYISKEQYRPVRKVYTSVCSSNPGKDKFWILDVDDLSLVGLIMKHLKDKEVTYTMFETVNGCHFVTKPFDSREFKEMYKDVDIKKNDLVLLYYKDSLNTIESK